MVSEYTVLSCRCVAVSEVGRGYTDLSELLAYTSDVIDLHNLLHVVSSGQWGQELVDTSQQYFIILENATVLGERTRVLHRRFYIIAPIH